MNSLRHTSFLGLFLLFMLWTPQTRAQTEDTAIIEKRIDTYCAKQGVDRQTLLYDENTDFSEITFAEIKTKYHDDINTLFAREIKILRTSVELEETLNKQCTEKSVSKTINQVKSTYELSQKALCRFVVFQFALKEKLNETTIPSKIFEASENQQLATFHNLALYKESIQNELLISKKSLDDTLATYDSLIEFFPLHVRLKCIIGELIILRKEVADLTDLFYYMEKYINAASNRFS